MKNSDNIVNNVPPHAVIPASVDVPLGEKYVSRNGVSIYVLSASEYDVVRFSFVFRAGSSCQDVPFCASATVNNLAEGSLCMTAQEIAERLDYYGSYYDVSIDRDWSVVSFVCLTKFFDQTIAIAREIVLGVQFPEGELKVYCDKSRQNLTINRTKVDFNARELFAKSIYGVNHPYGTSSPAEAYDTLTRDDVRAFYEKHYTAGNCFVVMSGNVDGIRRRALEDFVGDLPSGSAVGGKQFPEPVSVGEAFMPFPGAVQSAIRVGRVLFPRSHPDFTGMQVVATVLGGYFGSRLVRNLREEKGYTYGAYSAMVNFDRSGYFAAATEVGTMFAEDAMRQILLEIERMRTELVSGEELELVKNIMFGEVMRILDGPFGIADVTIENTQNGFDNGYIERFVDEIRAVTPERVRELAVKYLDSEHLTKVVVGEGECEAE